MSGVRRVYYDTEFLEDGRTVELLSIGMVDDDGRELYLINIDFPLGRLRGETWLEANVVPHLPLMAHPRLGYAWDLQTSDTAALCTRSRIAVEVKRFLTPSWALPAELWGYFPAYDQIALNQLWGRFTDVPPSIPHRTRDVADLASRGCLPGRHHDTLSPHPRAHHSLHDARWNRDVFQRHYAMA